MSTPIEGYKATLSLGGTTVALLVGVEFSAVRDVEEFAAAGEDSISAVLLGPIRYSGRARKAYVDNEFLSLIVNKTELVGTIYPRGDSTPYIAGTVVVTGYDITGMEAKSQTPVLEELTFVMYNVTKS